MSIATYALKHRTIVSTVVALLVAYGCFVFMTIPRREDPAYTVRTCQILTTWPGTPTRLMG